MGRPLGVGILAIIAFFIGLVEIFRSLLAITSLALAFPLGIHFPNEIEFPLYFVVGMIWLFVSYSFWKGAEIGWLLGIIMAALIAVLNFPVGTVFGALVIIYLVFPKGVRDWFSKPGFRKWIGV